MKKVSLIVLAIVLGCSSEGIITLKNYPDGVAFCESQYSAVISNDEATVWNDGTATYVVNAGHYGDKQVQQLINLAHKECAKYKE